MNYKDFYSATEQRIIDSILSLWATGDSVMQNYLREIFAKEPLLAKPVIQNAFPWEPDSRTFGELGDVFKENGFIQALDKIKEKEFRFPKTQHPYKHQLESWKSLIEEKKSIVVTTGTGSGKTECFMLPVLYDIYENSRNSEGINAIFLYPLNALIGSQKKRVHAWAKSLGGIKYAVYNGNTTEHHLGEHNNSLPEIVSRDAIRATPPQVLFTNPTMLEYILVRNKDVDILQKSKGKLRWILLDEAHTLTGSKATEMAMLIRRVLDAFGVKPEDVRFAATSATVGKDADFELLKFMAGLCGIHENQIKIIKGKRVLPDIGSPDIPGGDWDALKFAQPHEIGKYENVHKVRRVIYERNALECNEIGKIFNANSVSEQLELVDLLAETQVENNSIFPVRGHFFARSIGGVYVCTNKDCGQDKFPDGLMGSMTTIATKTCKCGWPVLELVQCRSCGNHLLHGEKYTDPVTGKDHFRLNASISHDAFQLDDDTDQTEEQNNTQNSSNKIYAVKYHGHKKYVNADHLNIVGFEENGELLNEGDFITAHHNNQDVCPHCGESAANPIHFRISSSFLNRTLADIILEQTPVADRIERQMLWQGHKFISFTDSRQGTAKISALINIDNEKNWIQSQVFHALSEKRKSNSVDASTEEIEEAIRLLKEELISAPAILRRRKESDLRELQTILDNVGEPAASTSRIQWAELYDKLINNPELSTLLLNTRRTVGASHEEKNSLLKALMFDQFARRLPRERSSENLGLVSIVFPDLENVVLPQIAKDLGLVSEEWQSLLKIAADYVVRMRLHFEIPNDIKKFSSSVLSKLYNTILIYPPNTCVADAVRWPRFDKTQPRPNRLALLVSAGLGYTNPDEIDKTDEDNINELLEEIWKAIRSKILVTPSLGQDNGFYLNFEAKAALQLTDKVWLCPVKRRLIDCHFKGYSPWITGQFSEDNIRHFKVGEPLKFPYFPFPYHSNNGEVNKDSTRHWIEKISTDFRDQGIWNNLLERVILGHDLFLAGEHSAQISPQRLQELEERFEQGKLNILSCSTTMEMGVDIGGISAVVMNNVPPKPANYLQRAGRAGRRSEAKSLSLTICAPNPIGANVMKNPMWALEHKISPPFIAFNSPVIVERHINAFFMGKFLQINSGINIKETINGFFFADDNSLALAFQSWLINLEVEELADALKRLTHGTPLSDKTSPSLRSMVVANFELLYQKTIRKKEAFENALEKIIAEGYQATSPRYKALNYKFQQFMHKYLLSYLSEEGFIPSAGMPNGVVEFDNVNLDKLKEFDKPNADKERILSKENPSHHILRALSEYAPGNKVVIDGLSYVSRGITMKSQWGDAGRDIIQSCTTCGYQRKVEVASGQNVGDACPHCENNTLRGLRFADHTQEVYTEIIEPAGFAVDLYSSASRDVSESSPIQHVEPLLLGVDPWSDQPMSVYDIRQSSEDAEIIFYNMGFGNGYAVCLHCGKTAFSRDGLAEHRRLRGGRDNEGANRCTGNDNPQTSIRDRVILAGKIQTDYCEIRFRDESGHYSNNENLLWSLGVVLTKAFAGYLGVEESELDFGVKRYQNYRSLFIFDTASGGAGYAVQFSYFASEIFEAAKEIVKCNCDAACTECLIDRSSQWYINKLDRHLAKVWLDRITNLKVPESLLAINPDLQTVMGSVKEDILRLKNANQIDAIRFYANHEVSGWDTEEAFFVSHFKRNLEKDSLGIVVNNPLDYENNSQNLLTAIQLNSWAEIYHNPKADNVLKTLCEVQLKNGTFITYYAESFTNQLNQHWGAASMVYKAKSNGKLTSLNKVNIQLPGEKFFEVKIQKRDSFLSKELASVFVHEMGETNTLKLKEALSGRKLELEYSDRYLKSPLSVWLFANFLQGLAKELSFEITSLEVNLSKFESEKSHSKIFHNYLNHQMRDNELESLMNTLGFKNLTINSKHKDSIPHYRFLRFADNEKDILIRPDGGVAHGWDLGQYLAETDLSRMNDFKIVKKETHPILYTVLLEKE